MGCILVPLRGFFDSSGICHFLTERRTDSAALTSSSTDSSLYFREKICAFASRNANALPSFCGIFRRTRLGRSSCNFVNFFQQAADAGSFCRGHIHGLHIVTCIFLSRRKQVDFIHHTESSVCCRLPTLSRLFLPECPVLSKAGCWRRIHGVSNDARWTSSSVARNDVTSACGRLR